MSLENYRNLLSGMNGLTAESQRRFGAAVQCRSGCALCCHGLFDIGVLDAALLHRAWRNSAARADIEAAAEAILKQLERVAPEWRFPYDIGGIDDAAVDSVLEAIGMVACPVLGPGNRCSLYDDRPFYCRVHGLKVRDAAGDLHMDTECELNFATVPAADAWPEFDFSGLFTREAALIQDLGLNPDSRFLIPAVTTGRFIPIAETWSRSL